MIITCAAMIFAGSFNPSLDAVRNPQLTQDQRELLEALREIESGRQTRLAQLSNLYCIVSSMNSNIRNIAGLQNSMDEKLREFAKTLSEDNARLQKHYDKFKPLIETDPRLLKNVALLEKKVEPLQRELADMVGKTNGQITEPIHKLAEEIVKEMMEYQAKLVNDDIVFEKIEAIKKAKTKK